MIYRFFSCYLAITNSSLTILAPSPINFCTSSDPDTLIKVHSVWCATARASSVFPVPGGPYSNTPWNKGTEVMGALKSDHNYSCALERHFSNSLIIHQEKIKKITTVTMVWICDPNYHKILPTLALNFSKNY